MEAPRLTGKKRFRPLTRWAGAPLLVLQVEETYTHCEWVSGAADTERCVRWRDATLEDVSVKRG